MGVAVVIYSSIGVVLLVAEYPRQAMTVSMAARAAPNPSRAGERKSFSLLHRVSSITATTETPVAIAATASRLRIRRI